MNTSIYVNLIQIFHDLQYFYVCKSNLITRVSDYYSYMQVIIGYAALPLSTYIQYVFTIQD